MSGAALPQDTENVYIALTAKGIRSDIHVVARAEKSESEDKLHRAGADRVINPSSIGGRRIAMSILKPVSFDYMDTIFHDGRMIHLPIHHSAASSPTKFSNIL